MNAITVPIDTVPAEIGIFMVEDADRDAGAVSLALVLKWAKAGDGSWTTLSSGTDYNVTAGPAGVYWIEFLDTDLFDTAGHAILEVSADGADEYRERFWVFDPTAVPAQPASLDATERTAVADTTLRRKVDNARASSDGDAWDEGDEQYTLAGAVLATAGVNLSISGNLVTKREDGETTAFTRPLTTAEPGTVDEITGVG